VNAASDLALHLDSPAVQASQSLSAEQAETSAADRESGFIGRLLAAPIERLEQVRQCGRRYPCPLVAHGQAGKPGLAVDRDCHQPAVRAGLDGIAHQIPHDLLHASSIPQADHRTARGRR
jgi:hypothetical protein